MPKPFMKALLVALIALMAQVSLASPRIKDISKVGVKGTISLLGYGLVIGLDGTGDSKGTEFTVQSVVNMLTRMGVTVPANKVRTKNVAAVMVSGALPITAKRGTKIDVTVSSLGDASSLEGGTLLMTPLVGTDGNIYAYAQGAISVGGFKASGGGGDMVSQNYTLVGRIPGGATVEVEPPSDTTDSDHIDIALFNPDYTTAARIAEAIKRSFGKVEARPVDAGLVRVTVPADVKSNGDIVSFVASVETTRVEPDVPAIVVINEKTGTIVAGANVTIGAVAIAHGNLSIEIKARPYISQPAPFSKGKTTVVTDQNVEVDVSRNRLVAIKETASVADVAQALNALGVSPRDVIAIFQALKEAGALRAEIKIM